METPEGVLVEAARKGSKEAFSQIVRSHQVRVRAFLSKFVPVDDVVDDLAQETFLAAFQSLASYRAESPLRTWLLGIARHRALRYLKDLQDRRQGRAARLEGVLDAFLVQRIELETEIASNFDQRVQALEACLKTLPQTGARMVQEFYYKGRSAGEVAHLTGKTEGAIRITLMRLRHALSQCIELRLRAVETL
jgi:RNA polymerase sigma-70 factor (ECF subfamily)